MCLKNSKNKKETHKGHSPQLVRMDNSNWNYFLLAKISYPSGPTIHCSQGTCFTARLISGNLFITNLSWKKHKLQRCTCQVTIHIFLKIVSCYFIRRRKSILWNSCNLWGDLTFIPILIFKWQYSLLLMHLKYSLPYEPMMEWEV